LALCNSVLVDKNQKTQQVEYKSISPDEIALVNGAKENAGIELTQKDNLKKEV
jgi:magnesium-transporting ATPase (P-type)